MASLVMEAFRSELAADLTADEDAIVTAAFGGGPKEREVERSIMLADRAVRRWAAGAVAEIDPAPENRLEVLEQLGKPEDGHHADGAARLIAEAHPDERARAVARAARDVALSLPDIDDLASNESNRQAFEVVARAAARCLLTAADIHGRGWLLAEADKAVREVAVLKGWTSQLAPEARRSPPAS